jgi:hypothetical protein
MNETTLFNIARIINVIALIGWLCGMAYRMYNPLDSISLIIPIFMVILHGSIYIYIDRYQWIHSKRNVDNHHIDKK